MFGIEIMIAVVGMLLTLSTTIMTFSLRRLTNDVHEVRLLMQQVAREQATDRLENEKRLGWLEGMAQSNHTKIESLESRMMRHLLRVRYGGLDMGEEDDLRS